MMAVDVQVRVLGPVDVVRAGEVVPIGSDHARRLLAALVVGINHHVSIDHLSQVLWGEDSPASRDNTLQSYVHRLRRIVGPESIVREDHGYVLRLQVDQLDALRFESLVSFAEARRDHPEECSGMCKEALDIWRGEAFGDLGWEDPFRLEAIRLGELRLFAMEMKLESDLARGRPEMVLGVAEALVKEHPYNERLWHVLIEALGRAGRRVDALRSLQELREILGEVGLEPSHELVEIEDLIVRDEI